MAAVFAASVFELLLKITQFGQATHRAHPRVQGVRDSWLGVTPVSSPKNIQFPCVEMSRRFLTYGDHTLLGLGP